MSQGPGPHEEDIVGILLDLDRSGALDEFHLYVRRKGRDFYQYIRVVSSFDPAVVGTFLGVMTQG
jgi:hypothetical protein